MFGSPFPSCMFLFFPPVFGILWEFKMIMLAFSSWFGYSLGSQFQFGLPQEISFGELHVTDDQFSRIIKQENFSVWMESHSFFEVFRFQVRNKGSVRKRLCPERGFELSSLDSRTGLSLPLEEENLHWILGSL